MSTLLERFESKFEKTDGCWEWRGHRHKIGYGQFKLNGKQYQAHRVAYVLYKGYIEDGMKVCHTCDNRGCVNPRHLWLGTQMDNVKDMIAKGRFPKRGAGESNPNARLTEREVTEIRALHKRGSSFRSLGRVYGVNRTTVKSVVQRLTWRHLP